MTCDSTIRSSGEITRVVGNSLAYIYTNQDDQFLSFVPNAVENYRGETFEELRIREGSSVTFGWNPSTLIVTDVALSDSSAGQQRTRGGIWTRFSNGHVRDPLTRRSGGLRPRQISQLELHPGRQPLHETQVPRALPSATRKFGKLIDTTALGPGDLLLSRDLEPDRISALITKVQLEGGYHPDDARWTHAAMYVGDGATVVEATFDSVLGGGSVRLTSLDEYSQGLHSLRFRRSKYILEDRHGWRVCIRAMSRLGKPYDFVQALLMWFAVTFRGQGFFGDEIRRSTSAAVICSTLYADSYNEATRRSLGETSGICVPAWLSASDEFSDVQAEWSQIAH